MRAMASSSGSGNRAKHLKNTVPSLRKELINAKLFLQQASEASGDSLFDHLSRVIAGVIDERPSNVVDYFESYSEGVRRQKVRTDASDTALDDDYEEPERLAHAQRLLPVLIEKSRRRQLNVNACTADESIRASRKNEEEEEVVGEEEESEVIYDEVPASAAGAVVKDLCELQFYWNLLGIGFPREEVFALSCSMRKLRSNGSFAACRFWGKIFGLESDYYVVECTLTEDAVERRIDAIEEAINIINFTSSNEEFSPISDHRESQPPSASSTSFEKAAEQAAATAQSPQFSSASDGSRKVADDVSTGSEPSAAYPTGWNFSMNIPRRSDRSTVEIPAETIGQGVNRYVYYVCNRLHEDWVELPTTTPQQINASRRMSKYLTGNLDAEICSCPAFLGLERNYLRAIIARISAGAQVAPRGFYTVARDDAVGDETEDVDDDEFNNDKPIKVNESYRPLPIEKLLKLDYWQHIRPEILKQGRIRFLDSRILAKFYNNNNNKNFQDKEEEDNDKKIDDDDDSDDDGTSIDEEEEEAARHNASHPEMPAPLFASCSSDRLTNESISPWTIRLNDVVESPLVLIQSRIWPGAYAFVKDRICDNIYIGHGHKYSPINSSPPALLRVKQQYPHGLDTEEADGGWCASDMRKSSASRVAGEEKEEDDEAEEKNEGKSIDGDNTED